MSRFYSFFSQFFFILLIILFNIFLLFAYDVNNNLNIEFKSDKIIAYTLFGDLKNDEIVRKYLNEIPNRLEEARILYPEWNVRIYHDDYYLEDFLINDDFTNLELINVRENKYLKNATGNQLSYSK